MSFKKLHTSSNSVEIKSVLMSHSAIRDAKQSWPSGLRTLTFLDFKNGWNTSMCSSSTLAINPCVIANYPPKKWNTPVPLFHQNQSNFFRNNADFNNSLTKLLLSSNSVEIKSVLMFFCLKLHTSSNSVEIKPVRDVRPEQIRVIPITFFNFKNGCPTSPGTGTLRRQPPMFHPLNPLKTVPPL